MAGLRVFAVGITMLGLLQDLVFRTEGLTKQTIYTQHTNLSRYMPTSGYITESTNSRSVMECGATCLMTSNCTSFFYDSSVTTCQLRKALPNDADSMTISSAAKCFTVEEEGTGNAVRSCPVWTTTYNNGENCYFFNELIDADFDNSKQYCEIYNGSIVKIDSQAQNDFIVNMLQLSGTAQSFYIGLNDRSSPNDFRWSDTLTSAPQFTNWGSSNPSVGSEDCVVMYQPDGYKWHSTTCSNLWKILCQLYD